MHIIRSSLLALAAVLIAAAQSPSKDDPLVQPVDATAAFQGDGHPVKFDPSCRDYTIDTLPSNPACAARVAAGETAPLLAAAANSAALKPPRVAEAIAVLNKAIAVEDHPAAHHLLGTIYGTGELARPDYALAVRHLTIASDRGNPAAADLLARLVVDGKGAPRDLPRAIRLYRQAAAGGVPSAATALALIYLRGRFVARDDVTGGRLMTAAASAGEAAAARLAPLVATSGKVHNFQLVPAESDAAIVLRDYGTFDNPEIPPSFGFDDPVQVIHFAPYDDSAILARLGRDPSRLTAPYLYEYARRLAVGDPPRALRFYILAKLRMTYDATRCADPAALEALRAWDLLVGPDFGFAARSATPASLAVAARAALADEAAMPGDDCPWWVCRSGMTAMTAAIAHRPAPLALKPLSEWPALRAAARARVEALAAQGSR